MYDANGKMIPNWYYKHLLQVARQHFEETTNLETKHTILNVESDWDAFIIKHNLHTETEATHSTNDNGHSVITVRNSYKHSDVLKMMILLHELTHQFEPKHNDNFYRILKQTGVRIGAVIEDHPMNGEYKYRREHETPTIRGLVC